MTETLTIPVVRTWVRCVALMVTLLAALACVGALRGSSGWFAVAAPALFAVAWYFEYGTARSGFEVRADSLVVRNAFRRAVVRWEDIASVLLEPDGPLRYANCVVRTCDGGRYSVTLFRSRERNEVRNGIPETQLKQLRELSARVSTEAVRHGASLET